MTRARLRHYDAEPEYAWDPAAPPRVLTYQQALRLGYTPAAIAHQLRRGTWRKILPHVYFTGDVITWTDKLNAALAFAGPGALLSGAAALCDLELRSVQRPDTMLVLVPAGRQPRSAGWVQIRPSARPVCRALLPGAPRAEVARAVADTAVARRRLDDVRALVAEVVQKKHCSIDELAVELRRGPQRGSAFLRQAIDEIGAGAWSAPEARAAALLRVAGAPPFEQNRRIDLPGGRYVIADFVWIELRAVLEIDSMIHHHDDQADVDRTDDKHIALETVGFSVIHRTPRYVITRPEEFTRGVLAWLDTRRLTLS
jgi:hypothetical protein